MRRLIAGTAARNLVAKALPPSNRGRGLSGARWIRDFDNRVNRAEPSADDLAALATYAEPWWQREESDPARNRAEARAEIEALVRGSSLSRSEADAVALVARGIPLIYIARLRGITPQAAQHAVACAIRKMGEPTPMPTPAAKGGAA